MTKESSGLGSGALREALEHTAKLFHRHCAYVSHASPHAGVIFEDCMEVECVENRRVLALSLSSPIEPREMTDFERKEIIRLASHPNNGETVAEYVETLLPPQASSEVREATEAAIEAFGGCLCTCDETPHRRACNVVIATKLREALAPSRQGAAKRVKG